MRKNKQGQMENNELSVFCAQLATLIGAGFPTYYGISLMMEDTEDPKVREFFRGIYLPLEKGDSLYHALKDCQVFPEYMLDMIDLGEKTGRLEEVLSSLAHYYEQEASLQDNLRHSLTYPLLMVVMMFVVLFVLVDRVVPVFSDIYSELGTQLTGGAAFLMEVSQFLDRYLIFFLILLLVLALALWLLFHSSLKLTLLGDRGIFLTTSASRVANCLYLSLSSGLDTSKGIDFALRLMDNPHMVIRLKNCRQAMQNGDSFYQALQSSKLFSRTYSSWITIGEKTGTMDEVMKKIADSYEQETRHKLDHFLSLLEPALVILLSLLIGIILISFLLPMLGIMSSIG